MSQNQPNASRKSKFTYKYIKFQIQRLFPGKLSFFPHSHSNITTLDLFIQHQVIFQQICSFLKYFHILPFAFNLTPAIIDNLLRIYVSEPKIM